MEIGLLQGYAQDFSDSKRVEDLRYNEQLKKQAQIAAQNKAKMFADDFDYNNAMNEFDNPRVKQFAQFQIKRIGQFVNQNPDWETNVEKRAQYKQLIRELKDNPDLNRGLQTDANIKKFREYAADPKNNEMINTPEFQAEKGKLDNYLKYGNPLGEAAKGEKAEYMFMAPEESVDYTKYLVDIARQTAKHGTAGAAGAGGYRQFVTDADKQSALQLAKSNPMFRYLKKDFEKMTAEQQQQFGTVDEYVLNKMQPYFPEDDIKPGQFFAPQRESAANANLGAAKNPFEVALSHAQRNPAGVVQVAPQTINDTFADSNGMFDLSNTYVVDQKTGNKTQMNLGKGKAEAYGNLKYIKNDKGQGYYVVPVKVRLPVNQFIQKFGSDALDYSGFAGGITNSLNGAGDETEFTIHDGDGWDKDYTGQFEKVTDDKGKNYIQFESELPIQNNEIVAARFNTSVKGGKNADFYTSNQEQPLTIVKISPDKTKYQASDGHIYDAKTNQRIQ